MPSASTVVTRRLVVPDAFRWAKLVFGLLMIAGPAYVGWAASWNELSCKNEACELRQEFMLQSTGIHRFDARIAPSVVVSSVKIGKNGQGKMLALHYSSVDVELLRGDAGMVEAEASRLRDYFARPVGSYDIEEPRPSVAMAFAAFMAWFGLLMVLDALTLLGFRRVRSDAVLHRLTVDFILMGLRVKRRTFPIDRATTVGREQVAPNNARFYWLTIEEPGSTPTRVGVLDRPHARDIIEHAVEHARRGL